MSDYNPEAIEEKWQQRWADSDAFATPVGNNKPFDSAQGKRYVLDMFPYPSGDGLHVGHVKIYTGADVAARYYRMKGESVLHPTGWDAFGLPTENSAIKFGVHPADLTKKNTDRFREQMKMMGWSYDWGREVNTTDPAYYKWTQWIFLQLFKRGLAYEDTIPINWCPSCKTGLANEEVVDGHCDRCGHKVELKDMRQWMLKITAYADRLLKGLESLAWPHFILDMQRNWIGRSEGVNFKMKVKDLDIDFEVYDSVPQTFMAQTFVAIAPEHPLVPKLVEGTEHEEAVKAFVEQVKERKIGGTFDLEKEKDGIFTGRYAADPFGTGDLPVWVGSFVVADYGTGIVNCSAHDERDFDFAKANDIPLRPVMFPEDEKEAEAVRNLEYCYSKAAEGVMAQPEAFAGRKWGEARADMIEYIIEKGMGERSVQYKLRDWVFSRQRYWGEPIPIIHCEQCGPVVVPEDQLPVELPQVEKYEPTGTGESPLAAIDEWVNIECPECGKPAKRETNTMPQWAGSSWYWLRYIDPHNTDQLADPAKLKDWLPVNLYVGGAEHAVLHLLYARFWNMVLFDEKVIPNEEPFQALRNVGLVLGSDGQKMSKSRGNVVNPDDEVEHYGADTVRIFAMFMGPFDDTAAWTTEGIKGSYRFLKRLWAFMQQAKSNMQNADDGDEVKLKLHQTIKRVTEGVEHFRFNTAVAGLMELLNVLEEQESVSKETLDAYVQLLSPFAPHLAEELWEQLDHSEPVTEAGWPGLDEQILAQAQVTIAVQVNGKLRGSFESDPGLSEDDAVAQAEDIPNVAKHLDGKEIVKTIHIPDRMLNFVVK